MAVEAAMAAWWVVVAAGDTGAVQEMDSRETGIRERDNRGRKAREHREERSGNLVSLGRRQREVGKECEGQAEDQQAG